MKSRPGRGALPAFVRAFHAFTDGTWTPLRQKAMVLSLRPDWETAPRTFAGLVWYAGVFLSLIILGMLSRAAFGLEAVAGASVSGLEAFLRFNITMAFVACAYSAMGRWVIPWECVARTGSPLMLLALTYTVSGIDQLVRLAILAGFDAGSTQQMLMGAKGLFTGALTVLVLADYVRPRPPRTPRRKPESRKADLVYSTRPAPIG